MRVGAVWAKKKAPGQTGGRIMRKPKGRREWLPSTDRIRITPPPVVEGSAGHVHHPGGSFRSIEGRAMPPAVVLEGTIA